MPLDINGGNPYFLGPVQNNVAARGGINTPAGGTNAPPNLANNSADPYGINNFASLVQQYLPQFFNGANSLGQLGAAAGGLVPQAAQGFSNIQNQVGQLDPTQWGQQADQTLGGVQQSYQNIAGGTNDPRFQQFSDAQNAALDRSRMLDTNALQDNLARQGITGTAANNELLKLGQGYDVQSQQLASRLGLQQLGRQDTALGNVAGIAGQRAGIGQNVIGQQSGLLGQEAGILGQNIGAQAGLFGQEGQLTQDSLNALSAGLTSAGAIPSMNIAATAAQNAGRVPSTSGGGKK